MSPQQKAEVEFWRGEFAKYKTPEEYVKIRQVRDLGHYAELLPEIHTEKGYGLDLGCGLVSVLGGLERCSIVAVDPLQDEYHRIYFDQSVTYNRSNGEKLKGFICEEFDFVWCMNAIDHTPNPERMIAEAHRVLKVGGHLYFFVNFDPELYAPHYHLWDMSMVEVHLCVFKLLRGTQAWSETWKKYIYAGLYRKEQ